jgi:hypothetical protein
VKNNRAMQDQFRQFVEGEMLASGHKFDSAVYTDTHHTWICFNLHWEGQYYQHLHYDLYSKSHLNMHPECRDGWRHDRAMSQRGSVPEAIMELLTDASAKFFVIHQLEGRNP